MPLTPKVDRVPIPRNKILSPCEKLYLLLILKPDVPWSNSFREYCDFEFRLSCEEILKGALINGIENLVALTIIESKEIETSESEFTCPLITKLKDKQINKIYKFLEFNKN